MLKVFVDFVCVCELCDDTLTITILIQYKFLLQSKCFIKLHKIGKLQGSAKVFNAKKLLGRKRRIGRLPKYYEVESLETIGSCCWKVCMNSRGKCIGRFVPGGTRAHSLSHIRINRVKRVKALKRKNCPQGSLRRRNIP